MVQAHNDFRICNTDLKLFFNLNRSAKITYASIIAFTYSLAQVKISLTSYPCNAPNPFRMENPQTKAYNIA